MTDIDILNRITAARFWAATATNRDVAFYGSLAMRLPDVLDDTVETACTNGKVIKWGRQFVRALYANGPVPGNEQVRFVLLHEVAHCAHGHLWRLPLTREGNIAGDYAINAMLRSVPGVRAPKGALDDRTYDGLAEEEILGLLPKPSQPQPPTNPKPGDGKGAGEGAGGEGVGEGTPGGSEGDAESGQGAPPDEGGCGGFEAPADDAEAEGDADDDDAKPGKPGNATKPGKPGNLREDWEQATVQAAQIAQALAQGNMPAEARRQLERIAAKAKPDWRAETAEFVRASISSVPDWSRQARRTATAPVIYPRRKRDDLGVVVFVRDTSGSITHEVVAQFNTHIGHVIAETGCDAVVLDADAAVQAEYRLTPGDEVPDRAEGGGGTDFRPAFARVQQMRDEGERVAGVVYLTDLLGYFPDEPTDVPVLWAATTDGTAPFGRTVQVEV